MLGRPVPEDPHEDADEDEHADERREDDVAPFAGAGGVERRSIEQGHGRRLGRILRAAFSLRQAKPPRLTIADTAECPVVPSGRKMVAAASGNHAPARHGCEPQAAAAIGAVEQRSGVCLPTPAGSGCMARRRSAGLRRFADREAISSTCRAPDGCRPSRRHPGRAPGSEIRRGRAAHSNATDPSDISAEDGHPRQQRMRSAFRRGKTLRRR